MWDYTQTVQEHFLHPRNAGVLENANAIGEVGSLACGDALKLYLRIENNRIIDASFQTFGCASAIASSSALTEMIKGKTLEEAQQITNHDIATFLGGLPKQKMHCSVMGQEALEAAIRNYRGEPAKPHSHEGNIICHCFGITDIQIRKAAEENNLTTFEEITHFTKAGGGCGDCREKIELLLGQIAGSPKSDTADNKQPIQARPALSNMQRMQRVQAAIADVIRPRLQQDGGDIELVDIDRTTVWIALRGMCSNCPSSKLTIEEYIQPTLREQVDAEIIVRETEI